MTINELKAKYGMSDEDIVRHVESYLKQRERWRKYSKEYAQKVAEVRKLLKERPDIRALFQK